MYAPVNVYNPASRNHTALLHPGQTLRVTFHNTTVMDDCKAHILSDLVEISHETYMENAKTFVFRQVYNLEQWANVSTTFLGQIYFSGRGKVNPAVSLYLASSNEYKRDIITAVNPQNQTIKLHAHQILEVVTYSPIWGQDLDWTCDEESVALELLSDIRIDPTVYKMSESIRTINDAFYTYPRMVEKAGVPYLEYHWWYRWREMSAKLAKSFQCPPIPLSFVGRVDGEVKIRQDFHIMLNDRAKPDWHTARSFNVTFEDSAMDKGHGEAPDYTIQPFILPTLRNELTPSYKPNKKRHHKNKQGRIGHVVAPHQHHGGRHHNNHGHKHYTQVFQAREVQIRIKPMASLDAGCNVVSDDPIVTIPKLPAPIHNTDNLGYSCRTKSQFTPPKAGYYYDGPDEQWD